MILAKCTRSFPPLVRDSRPSACPIMKCPSAPPGFRRTAASPNARASMYRLSRRCLEESSSPSICLAMSTSSRAVFHSTS